MINVTTNYLDFKNEMTHKFGFFYEEQTDIFFERSVFEAKKRLFESALTDAKFALNLSYLSNNEYSKLFIIGFISQVYCDLGKISKARKYCQLGMKLLDYDSEYYHQDLELFQRLEEMIKSESWKENLEDE